MNRLNALCCVVSVLAIDIAWSLSHLWWPWSLNLFYVYINDRSELRANTTLIECLPVVGGEIGQDWGILGHLGGWTWWMLRFNYLKPGFNRESSSLYVIELARNLAVEANMTPSSSFYPLLLWAHSMTKPNEHRVVRCVDSNTGNDDKFNMVLKSKKSLLCEEKEKQLRQERSRANSATSGNPAYAPPVEELKWDCLFNSSPLYRNLASDSARRESNGLVRWGFEWTADETVFITQKNVRVGKDTWIYFWRKRIKNFYFNNLKWNFVYLERIAHILVKKKYK